MVSFMNKLPHFLFLLLALAVANVSNAAESATASAAKNAVPQLPSWQQLEFEQKAFWATARSQLTISPVAGKPDVWTLDVLSSVVDNSEQLQISFDPATGQALSSTRVSRGKEQRMKAYQYETSFIVRERRNPPANTEAPPEQWPIARSNQVNYPASRGNTVVTSPYLLLIIATQLQAQGPGKSLEVIVHTDLNFYRVKLTTGNGIPVKANFQVTGQEAVSGTFDTVAVAIHASPEGKLEDKDDFSVLGLQGEIILLFDRNSGLPLQIRGEAPRIGTTEINLKSATLRAAP
jgi:hypothetical protein